MDGQYDRALMRLALRLQARKLVFEERQLLVTDREMAALGRDDPRALERIAIEPDDRHERCVQREVDAWLGHYAANEPTGVGRDTGRRSAKVLQKAGERRHLGGTRAW